MVAFLGNGDPSWADHAFVLVFVLGYPLLVLARYPVLRRRLEEGHGSARLRRYRASLVTQWGLVSIGLSIWLVHGRSLGTLGLGIPSTISAWVLLALVAALSLLAFAQLRAVPDARVWAEAGPRLRAVEPLLPRTRRELVEFRVVALTAGFCEEALFRGYLVWYLCAYFDLTTAGVLCGVLFGVAHAYQGAAGVVRVTIVGLVLAGTYLFTRSIWVPVAIHALIDLYSGQVGYRGLRRNDF